MLATGGGIERWEDPGFRMVYAQIMEGKWRLHDPYNLDARLHVKSRMYNTPNQVNHLMIPLDAKLMQFV